MVPPAVPKQDTGTTGALLPYAGCWNRAATPLRRSGAALSLRPKPPESSGRKGNTMATWTTPTLVEICIGLEINGYLPAEF
jgi:coenzyme PQQ precursor peptide PqqA